MLNISELEAYYGGSRILNQINMKVKKGQVACILGRNGVGKTTLLKSIMGLVKTPRGSILLEEKEMMKVPTYHRAMEGIGYVPQGREIFPQLTIHENLLLGLERSKNKGELEEDVYELFPVLKSMLKRKGGDLSGGQQQQLAIARALISKPKILLLDEPTEGIQPSIIQDIGKVIQQLKKQGNMTIIIVEQYLEFVLGIADYFFVMDKGKIVMEGNIKEADPKEIQSKMMI
ncbi:urea ABC transporter ATP-binding subunit UrtE [Clostridium formicaceticum]|uniref:High-affinity branched-chain amino acid transport ATP-binding protein LivF n=1 Tax=Clostridium formicaceticum TaxID=1497 RepID=A0AAC9RK82_9CLOT|nr:urea ABC transporter ATP-binding subunit UrtE [Clostridium formicaceticum]AOY76442.1 urea ABC transporter ATP-binding subunit UrtE [Clostridium formicaceticum]ARE86838.1 High-affinity branched-chain amino acid transport ATP-binding protein LivF [Clostridium formicaceticum]